MLEYKCQMHGKTLSKIGRFEPSSKICNWCGYIKQDLVLAEREWIRPDCGTHHDRDINAAINIKKFALQDQNLVGVYHCLAQSISDVSWSAFFTMLEYKCQMHGKTLSKIGRFDPSSKICSTCGYLNRDLARKDREWICP
jgi:transposase